MRKQSVLAPLILVTLGIVFLLNNFGFLPWAIWLSLWKFWPVLLVLIGVELLLGRSASIKTILILLALIFVFPIALFLNPFGGNPFTTTKTTINEALGSSVHAKVSIDLPAVNFKLKAIATDSAKLVTGNFSYSATGNSPTLTRTDDRNSSFFTVKQGSSDLPVIGSFRNDLNLEITRLVPIDLSIKTGANNLNLDLAGLRIDNLDIDTAAGNIFIKYSLGSANKTYIKTAASSITLNIPKGLESRVKINGNIKTLNLPKNSFKETDLGYETAGYQSAKTKLEVEIDATATSVTVTQK